MGLYRDETGMVIEIDDRFAEARGYAPLAPEDHERINAERGYTARADERGIVGDINAAATGVASGFTLGGTDWLLANTLTPMERERLTSEMEAHPNLRAGGEIVGGVASAFAAPGSALARTPAGYLGTVAAREVEAGLARGGAAGVGKALTAMGTEGALQNAGQYIGHSALEDKETTAEGLSGALGTGFAFGAAGGGAALGVAKGAMAGRRLYSRVMDGQKAAKAAESSWSLASQEALDADLATARVAETKLDEIRKAKMEALRYRNETRATVQEAKINASAAPVETPDFEAGIDTNVIPREQAPGGMPTSVFKRPAEMEGPVPLDEGITPASGGQVTTVRPPTTKKIPRPEGVELGPEYQTRLPTRGADVVDDTVTTVPARDIEAHGWDSLSVPGKDKVKTAKAQQAISEGQRDPITIAVSPNGRYTIEDGTHRLAAAIEQGKPVKVKWVRGSAALDEVPATGYVAKASKGNESNSIEGWLNESKAFDDAELSRVRKIEDIKGAAELRMRRQETLSEIRYKATEDLLGPQMAKEEKRLSDILDEYNAARKDYESLAGREGASTGVPEVDAFAQVQKTTAGSRGNRKAVEILDDAHEEALLRAKHAVDPREAGQAITEAEELENLLEGLMTPDLAPAVKGVSRAQLRSADAAKFTEELFGDVAKVQRYEEVSAKLADELGDQAHMTSVMKAKGLRKAESEAERKMMDRSTRAVDDAADYGPMPTPKERVSSARSRQNVAQSKLDELGVQEKEAQDALNKANRQAKIGEKAKKAAERAAPGGGKIGAQDVGGALEIFDLPGLPKPSDLPIVGPLLGAFLKFRTLKRAMGRAMGHVPATGNNRVAALAARTRDRIARAVDRSLGHLERGGKFAARVMPATAGILSTRIYDDGGENPPKGAPIQKLAAARMRELSAYVHTPGAIERDVRIQLRDVSDPDIIAAAEAHRRAMMEHLLKHAPKVPEQGLVKTLDWEPSPAQSMSFARRWEALDDPASVYERLAQEQTLLSLEAAEAMREVYPQLFKQAQQRAIERAGEEGTRVPYRQRVQMSLFYQVPFDAALDPVNFKITQSVYDRKPSSPAYNPAAPGVAPQAPTAQPAIANPVNLSEAYTPSMDRR